MDAPTKREPSQTATARYARNYRAKQKQKLESLRSGDSFLDEFRKQRDDVSALKSYLTGIDKAHKIQIADKDSELSRLRGILSAVIATTSDALFIASQQGVDSLESAQNLIESALAGQSVDAVIPAGRQFTRMQMSVLSLLNMQKDLTDEGYARIKTYDDTGTLPEKL